jgi:hypothetical protein
MSQKRTSGGNSFWIAQQLSATDRRHKCPVDSYTFSIRLFIVGASIVERELHSWRNATSGSTRVARCAGR